ncbi:MAG: archaemetzincin family Zn-dependent metalloprotease [Syntrophobacterales bacterium]|nr:MAG: archaemetzincin family Zn-dependent metalloprotease [Syntrophobacterales bacterium]
MTLIKGFHRRRKDTWGKKVDGKIVIVAVGKVDGRILEGLQESIGKVFEKEVYTGQSLNSPDYAYNGRRKQYFSSAILLKLREVERGIGDRVLGVADLDLYVPSLNFVFGEADLENRVAIISICRFSPEFYGLSEDIDRFKERVFKEAVHELGHTYGLGHCPNPLCVMHFSNSLLDTDIKKASLCPQCEKRLN